MGKWFYCQTLSSTSNSIGNLLHTLKWCALNQWIKCVCICVLCTPYRFGTHQFDAVQVAPSNACAERFSDLKRFVLYWFWFLLVTA